ncbi:MAG: acyltransferase, partial [Chitinophagaceae bacterium]|nr:acyltransferase [Chitinophagaceae bacterium]
MKYIKGFDGIRAVSILMVVCLHAGLTDLLPATSFVQNRLFLLVSGNAGVDMFFCLSGFLITRILLQEKDKSHTIHFRKFYARRFLRLLPPLIIFYIIILLLIALGYTDSTYTGLLVSFFYLYNYIPNVYYSSILGHTWSLGVEEQFYLIWPIIISIFNRYKIVLVCFIIILMCYIVPLLTDNITFVHNHKSHLLSASFKVNRFFLPAAYPIIAGCLLSVLIFYFKVKTKRIFENNISFLVTFMLFLSPLYYPFVLLNIAYLVHIFGIALLLSWIFYHPASLLTKMLEFKPLSY